MGAIDELRNKGDKAKGIITLIIAMPMILMAILIGITSLSWGGNENKQYSKLYYSNNYEIVEGVTSNFDGHGPGERYTVNGVKFDISRADATSNFIKSDGIHVRICYIPDDDLGPVIVKMEIESGYLWME